MPSIKFGRDDRRREFLEQRLPSRPSRNSNSGMKIGTRRASDGVAPLQAQPDQCVRETAGVTDKFAVADASAFENQCGCIGTQSQIASMNITQSCRSILQ